MSKANTENRLSRRAMLGSVAMATAGVLGAKTGGASAAEPVAGGPPRTTVRDRLWIFGVLAGGDNNSLERGNVRGGSRMTQAEGAFWLNVPNLLLIRSGDEPRLPGGQEGRAKTSFEQYAISFQPLDRVVWSVVGSGGKGGMSELGLKWLKEKRIHEMIFLANTVLDVGLPSAEFSRQWIAKAGKEPL